MNRRHGGRICLVLFGLLWPLDSFADTPVSAAQTEFDEGLKLLAAENDELALEHFLAAYALDPTPKIKANIIICLMTLERDVEAITEYDALVANPETKLSADTQSTLESYLLSKGKALGFGLLFIETSVPGPIFIDGKRLQGSSASLPRRAPAGKHTIRLEAPGMALSEQTVEVRSGERNHVRLSARRPFELDARLGLFGGGATTRDKLVPEFPCSVYCFPGLSVLVGARLSVPLRGPFVTEIGADYFHAQTSINDKWPTVQATVRFSIHALLAHAGLGMDVARGAFRFQWRIGGGFVAGQHRETPVDLKDPSDGVQPIFLGVLGARLGLSVKYRQNWFGIGLEGWSTLARGPSAQVPRAGADLDFLDGPPEAKNARPLGRVLVLLPDVVVGWEF